MPEGDSIHGLAEKLAPILTGRAVTAFAAHRIADGLAKTVVGHRIVSVSARGKNLLVRFDDERVLHVHLGMDGRMWIEKPRSTFWKPSRAVPDMRLALSSGKAIVGRRLPICRLLTLTQEKRASNLAGLGPDLLDPDFDLEEVIRRLRGLQGDPEIANALLMQHALAGVGNVYKSEVLFLESVPPRTKISKIADDKLRSIVRRSSVLLRRNVGPGPRTTRPTLGGGPRVWVYARGGKPCLRCKTTAIVRFMQGPEGGRSTYWCPTCQKIEPAIAVTTAS